MFDFGGITGNEIIIKTLQKSIINDRINHAYLFSGGKGMGKNLMANCFAKTLLCENRQSSGFACGTCSSCISFDSMNNPDVIRVIPTKTKALGVDDIREQASRADAIMPYKYRYKVFIIKDAHEMTTAAQNALLKTLEEPSSHGIFLLTATSEGLLLPTILSRCQILKFKPLSLNAVENYLVENSSHTRETARFLSVYSGGSIGLAIKSGFDDKFLALRQKVLEVLDGIHKKDLADVFLLAKELEPFKDSMDDALNVALLWYRDIAVLKQLGDESVMQKDVLDKLKANAEVSFDHVCKSLDAVSDARINLKYNANFQMAAEVMLLKLSGRL